MDPRLLQHYERELRHLREMGGEFAKEFPKIAGRLGLEGLECADPYVERLIESFGFLAARIQLRIDDEFPRFTQQLLELAYPHYLAPTPSMAVVRFNQNLREGQSAAGFTVERDTRLRGRTGRGDPTACEYRTRHPVELWPLQLVHAEYTTLLSELAGLRISTPRPARALVRLRLSTLGGLPFSRLELDKLTFFLAGGDEIAMAIYEQLMASALAVVVKPAGRSAAWAETLPVESSLRPLGFDDEDALLPYGARSFSGYRLLHEYFAFPSRYLFFELSGLSPAVRRCSASELELLVLLENPNPALEGVIDASRFQLFCAPAINLFPRDLDQVHVSDRDHEYHLVPDRVRAMDLEVHTVTKVTGYASRSEVLYEFAPLYAARDQLIEPSAYFTTSRVPRPLSQREREEGRRSTYIGSEVFLSLVDTRLGAPPPELRRLAVSALCTNRDLPLHLPLGSGTTDFEVISGAPVESVRCVAGPTAPRPSNAHGETAWRLVNHLSLNYLSILDNDPRKGAAALREMLALYAELGEPAVRKQVTGVQSVSSKSAVRPMSGPGAMCFGRGLEVTVTLDEGHFSGSGAFLLGAVLERFFAKYASINSFAETVLRTVQRGEIMRWPTISGLRHIV